MAKKDLNGRFGFVVGKQVDKNGAKNFGGHFIRFGTEPDENGKVPADTRFNAFLSEQMLTKMREIAFVCPAKGDSPELLAFPPGFNVGVGKNDKGRVYAAPSNKTLDGLKEKYGIAKENYGNGGPFDGIKQSDVRSAYSDVVSYREAQRAEKAAGKERPAIEVPEQPAEQAEAQPEM